MTIVILGKKLGQEYLVKKRLDKIKHKIYTRDDFSLKEYEYRKQELESLIRRKDDLHGT